MLNLGGKVNELVTHNLLQEQLKDYHVALYTYRTIFT